MREVCWSQVPIHLSLLNYINIDFIFFYSQQDADASEIKVQVCVYAFDLLYLNGKVSKVYMCQNTHIMICYLLYREIKYGPTQVRSIGLQGSSFDKDQPKPAKNVFIFYFRNKVARIDSEKLWYRVNAKGKKAIQVTAHTQERRQKFFALIAFIIQIHVFNSVFCFFFLRLCRLHFLKGTKT